MSKASEIAAAEALKTAAEAVFDAALVDARETFEASYDAYRDALAIANALPDDEVAGDIVYHQVFNNTGVDLTVQGIDAKGGLEGIAFVVANHLLFQVRSGRGFQGVAVDGDTYQGTFVVTEPLTITLDGGNLVLAGAPTSFTLEGDYFPGLNPDTIGELKSVDGVAVGDPFTTYLGLANLVAEALASRGPVVTASNVADTTLHVEGVQQLVPVSLIISIGFVDTELILNPVL